MSASDWPKRILGAFSPETFSADYWEKKPVKLPGHRERFDDLNVSMSTFIQLAFTDTRKGERLPLKAQFHHRGEHCEFPIRGEQIRSLYDAGLTACLWELQSLHPELQELVQQCRRDFQYPGPVYVNAYLSPSGGGFGIHFDRQSVIVLQLEGSKVWKYSPTPAMPSPQIGFQGSRAGISYMKTEFPDLDLRIPDDSELVEVELKAGDAFYMPGGTWHRPRAGNHSLALTLSFGPTNFQTMVGKAMGAKNLHDAAWRQYLPPGFGLPPGANGVPAHVETFLKQHLAAYQAYVAKLTVADVAKLWKQDWEGGEGSPEPEPMEVDVLPATRLAHTLPFRWEIGPNDDGQLCVRLMWGKRTFELPAGSDALLIPLAEHPTFLAREVTEWGPPDDRMEWPAAKEALEVLIGIGLLVEQQ